MKRLITHTFTSLMLAILGLAMTAQAESTTVIKVNIPFEFSFGGRTFPAGDYSLVEPLQHMLTLRNSRGQTLGSAFTSGVDFPISGLSTKVKFNSVGGQYILSEVWQSQDASGERLHPTKARSESAARPSTATRETAEANGLEVK